MCIRDRRWRLVAIPVAAAVIACSWAIASASGDVSHVGWPQRDTVWFANNSGQMCIRDRMFSAVMTSQALADELHGAAVAG